MLSAAVEKNPTGTALVFGETSVTYEELDGQSSKLARLLISHGVGPDHLVAIALDRSIESVASVWAVAKSGGAFLPIDLRYPPGRIEHMVTDSGVRWGLTTSDRLADLPDGVSWIALDGTDEQRQLEQLSAEPIAPQDRLAQPVPANLAYVIYTSGSTGRPKGVAVTHAGLAPLAATVNDTFETSGDSRTMHFASPSFDASVLELLISIVNGSTMVIVPSSIYGGTELTEIMAEHRVTHAIITPAALTTMDSGDLPELRALAVGGETFTAELMGRWARGRQFHNAYGPTETTVICSLSAPLVSGGTVDIGSPTQSMASHVLDDRLRPVPTGVVGELYMSGPGLARGYLQRNGLTAQRFVANPFAAEGYASHSRMYRTGDLVRWRQGDSGPVVEYVGRNDAQIQLRGFRIELGEIDAVLAAVDGVDFAVTVGYRRDSGATELVGYVLPHVGVDLDVDAVIDAAKRYLPAHMVPTTLTMLESIPLTPAGKLDRSALPEPVFAMREFSAPTTPTEITVAEIFADLLGVDEVGSKDEFFALGGNSLLATQAAARIGTALGRRVRPRALFDNATVESLAAAIDTAEADALTVLDSSRPRPQHIPLSPAQQRMWFLNQFDTASAMNNVPVALALTGALDVDALRAAIADVIVRHESLRTVYPELDGTGFQQVLDPSEVQVTMESAETARDFAIDAVGEFLTRGFDVTTEIPFRVTLFEITDPVGTEPEFVLAFVAHHISADGLSMAPLSRDVMIAYAARTAGAAPDWTPLAVQYADYTLWQYDMLGSADDPDSLVSRQIGFWRAKLAGAPEQLQLPWNRARPRVASGRGELTQFTVDAQTYSRVLELARGHDATPFMVVHAALAVLLARLSGSLDIAVGAPVGGRGEAQLDDLVGMFVNTVVLRTDIEGGRSFAQVLEEVRSSDVEAFENADVPFERLVEVLDPVRSQNRHPLVQVALFFQNFSEGTFELPGLTVSRFGSAAFSAKFDLQVTVTESSGGLDGELLYATDLFDAGTVVSFGERLVALLDAVTENPEVPIGDHEILSENERYRILQQWNDTHHADMPGGELLLDGFDRQVAVTPDAVALAFGDEQLTYAQFAFRIDDLAERLNEDGAGPGSLVGLAMRRSIELLVGMYAVLRTGAAYVPLDPDQPSERNGHILATADPMAVLSTSRDDFTSGRDVPIVLIDRMEPAERVGADFTRPRPDDLAYVLFTSGSTGRPKGVAVEHRAIVNQMRWMADEYGLDESDVYLQKTATTFDVSLWGFFLPLRTGGQLIIAPPGAQREVDVIADSISRHRVTVTDFVPSMLTVFAESVSAESISTLRHIFVIGEALPARTVAACRAVTGARVHNLYGPTEAAVSVTYRDVSDDLEATGDGSVSIGVPEWNTVVRVLDSRLRPVPTGVPGELYLAGVQLARGYVTRPDLTSERFVADPFGSAGDRMYRTGDLVRWSMLGDGRIEYIGRTDFQVKFRGQRIELGEIETALIGITPISQAVVVVAPAAAGELLAAYLVPTPGESIDTEGVRSALGGVLPSYMVPSAFVVLDALPLNPAGKLDRRALPDPVFEVREFRSPTTAVEEAVASVFADVLGVERVGLGDDFFALGGNSLIATRVVSSLGAALDSVVPLRVLFESPTVEELAARVVSGQGGLGVPLTVRDRPEHIPLSLAQQRMWFMNRFEPDSAAYNLPIVIRLAGELNIDALASAARDIVGRQEILRTVYPETEFGALQLIRSVSDGFVWPGVESVSHSELIHAVTRTVGEGFDVTAAVPVRIRLFQVQPDEFVFVLVVHHISADGSSMAPFARDLMIAYSARARDELPAWSPLSVQYADYTLWQREVLGSEDDPQSLVSRQLGYWRSALADVPDQLSLPTDRPRPAVQSYAGARVQFSVDGATHRALEALGRRHNASLFMVLHAAYAVLLARTAGVDDVVVATPIAGRGDESLRDMIGQFANTLVLRSTVDLAASFDAFLESVRSADLDAFGHADVPFERVVEAVAPVRSTAHQPLAQVGFSFQNFEQGSLTLDDLVISPMAFDFDTTQYDIHLILGDSYDEHGVGVGLAGTVTYSTALFDESTVSALAARFALLLSAVGADSSIAVGDLDYMTTLETQSVLGASHGESKDVGRDATLVSLFDEQVATNPTRSAVVFEGETATYAEFDARANSLARLLIELGVGPEILVGLSMRRSVELMVAMYAVVKAGGAYLPLDPDQPASRTQYILDTSDPTVVLTTSRDETADWLVGDPRVIETDSVDLSDYSSAPVTDAERVGPLSPESLAYVIFTSGSTGRPKGVAVSHRAIANQLLWKRDYFDLGVDDSSLLKTAATFDLSVWEFWSSLTSGGSVVVASVDGHRDPMYLTELIESNSVTTLHVVPSMLGTLVAAGGGLPDSVRRVLAIGEALPAETAAMVRRSSSAEVFNLYGPTEAAVSVTNHRIVDEDSSIVPIGMPEWNSSAMVLDGRLRMVPVGIPGDLYLAGVQLARGYVGRPDLSSERFVANPFGSAGARMYRTGDVVIRRIDGELLFVGRSDSQVKIRGFRIEPGEIETALRELEGVEQSAVVTRTDAHAGEQLVGYVVPSVGVSVDVDVLELELGSLVPSYMVPSVFVVLDALPLNVNGKLDRRALPDPVFEVRDFRSPTSAVEESVASVFADVLGVERVGLDDDFFSLGGNSLIATRVVSRLGAVLGSVVPLRVLFEASTVEGLAARVVSGAGGLRVPLTVQERPERVPLSLAQQRMWFLNQLDPSSGVNNVPVALRVVGVLDVEAVRAAVLDVVGRHEVLRTVYPQVDGVGFQRVLGVGEVGSLVSVEQVASADVVDGVVGFCSAGFDVTVEVPFRVRLFEVLDAAGSVAEHVLAFVAHHISADGVSMGPLSRDVMTAYVARAAGEVPQWEPLEVQYADYTLWQLKVLGSADDPNSLLSRQERYWRQTLDGFAGVLDLPVDRPRPAAMSGRGASHAFTIGEELYQRIVAVAGEHRATVFMVLHTAVSAVLARLTGSADVAVGTPIAGRGDAALDDVVGMFVNTLVLRTRVDSGARFDELLAAVRQSDIDAFENAEIPFERIVEVLNPPRHPGVPPLVQVMFAFENMTPLAVSLPGLSISGLNLDSVMAKMDIQITFSELVSESGHRNGLGVYLVYAADLFDEITMVSVGEQLVRMLEAVTSDRRVIVGDVELVGVDDVRGSADGDRVRVEDNLVLGPFSALSVATPGAVAVKFGDTVLSYGELAARVNRLARFLISEGVGPEVRVGIGMKRSADSVVAVLAVLMSGGAYVPVDPEQPADRVGYTLERSGAVMVLANRGDGCTDARFGIPIVCVDELDLGGFSPEPIRPEQRCGALDLDNAAYVLFTSGSTGRPKGVVVSYRSIVNQLAWLESEFELTSADRVLLKTPSTFDASVWELLSIVRTGGLLVVAEPDGHRDPAYLASVVQSESITVVQFVPSVLEAMLDWIGPGTTDSLRLTVVGGEALPASVAARFAHASGSSVRNVYGPTETAVQVLSRRVSAGDRGTVPLGDPVWNTRFHVLDSRLHPVSTGVVGELYLSGVQLARGYVGRPDLSSERFVADPFAGDGSRLYRTGDLVRRTRDGELLFVGRSDLQVKFRGQRIELGEIETALTALSSVSRAVVVVSASPVGESLAAYVVPAPEESIDTEVVRSALGGVLPSYMVPSAFVVLDALPLNVNGKLDRRALPDPVFEARDFRPPTNAVEESVASVFADVLGVERVGLDDDFFALGGNSLIAARVVSRLGAALDSVVPLRMLFEASTVEELAARVVSGSGEIRVPLTVQERPERVPLSLAQQRMWFLNRLDPSSGVDNVPVALRVVGVLDVEALGAAVADVVDRHEVLRTVYPQVGGVGFQRILGSVDVASIFTVSTVSSSGVFAELAEFCSAGFDVSVQVPFKVRLFEVTDSPTEEPHAVLAAVAHHIAADGVSMGPLSRDVMTAYVARAAGRAPQWEPLEVQYADYTLWQLKALGSADDTDSAMRRHLDYWVSTLSGAGAQLTLPSDRPRPAEASHRGGSLTVEVPADVVGGVAEVARKHGATTFMAAHAALVVVLARLSGTDDITVGTPISGRGDAALDDLVGMFVNTLVLRSDYVPGRPFSTHLELTKAVDLDAFEHADVPFESIVDAVSPPRSAAHHPLFQVLLAFQNHERASIALPGLHIESVEAQTGIAKFDLQFTVADNATDDGRWLVGVDYAADLFDESTVRSFADMFVRVLESVSRDDSVAVGDIAIMDPADSARLTDRVRPAVPDMQFTDIVARFEEQVSYDAAAVAVTFDGVSMSYGQLSARANGLARELIAAGAGPETLVAVALPRSADLVVALVAVLTSGAGYLPIDSTYPMERLEFMFADARPVAVLTTAEVQDRVPASSVPVLFVDDCSDSERDSSPIVDAERSASLRADNTAYVIYTSGSTGMPKGVRVSHRNVAELLHNTDGLYRFDRDDVWTMFHSFAFDFSVWELWTPLLSGGRVVVVDFLTSRSPEATLELVAREKVTVLNQTPSAFYQLIEADRIDDGAAGELSLRYIIFGGEALDPGRLQPWYDRRGRQVELVNMYGITETTVHVTHLPLDENSVRRSVSSRLGDPIPGLGVYVLDARLRPAPAGVPGEIYVSGRQLARGYSNRPDLDAVRFVADPFAASGERLYRTGDVARITAAGDLEYVGRSDGQVQLRGFRIELGEIEAALERHESVARAVAHIHTDGRLGERLIAYVVPRVGFIPDTTVLLRFVGGFLTGYMIPDAVSVLETLPLTANGKLDRRALPDPVFEVRDFRAPTTAVEESVAAVFADVLGVERVGLDDDFFSLGGNSLLAVQLVSRLNAAVDGARAEVSWMFADSSVGAIASRIAATSSSSTTGGGTGLETLICLRAGGDAPPLFCVHPVAGLAWPFGGLVPHIDTERPIYGLQSPAFSAETDIPNSIRAWASFYVGKIREIQPCGPYHLIGWSLGGLIAHAMAVELQNEGEEVATLAMMDSFVLNKTEHVTENPVTLGEILGGLGIDSHSDSEDFEFSVESVVDLLRTMPAPFDTMSRSRVERIVEVIGRSVELASVYEPPLFEGRLAYFASVVDDPSGSIGVSTWSGAVAGEVTVTGVHSTHWHMASGSAFAEIGPVLNDYLRGKIG
ncbi:non-ribosomal peptide synthetase [Rhodococcus sp. WWJCD1]|uniref:non-ribosomal peptide synthetase n=1 Tax=Rhodococcus sp. WWJCD1 TaxID=2022519 RepID=UPI0015952E10|nr:non-ribosomal peptide synthetase [Rhodococcus sp. WWJCD1]